MSSVTAVPILPVKRGYLVWLWIGILVAVLAAAALAAQAPAEIKLETIKAGVGPHPTDTDVALVTYEGRLADGTVFDKSQQPTPMPIAGVVPGFAQGLKQMSKGGRYKLTIPQRLAYGDTPPPGAPTGTLTFDVTLIDFMDQNAFRQQMMMMQQMQGGGMGGPGGGLGGAPGAGAGAAPGGR